MYHAAHRIAMLLATSAPFSPTGRERYRRELSYEYAGATGISRFLLRRQRDNVYIAGDPLIFTLSGSSSRVPINGWGLELLIPRQWPVLAAELAAARPDAVFITRDYAPVIREHSPSIERWIQRTYRTAESTTSGTWYARDPSVLP